MRLWRCGTTWIRCWSLRTLWRHLLRPPTDSARSSSAARPAMYACTQTRVCAHTQDGQAHAYSAREREPARERERERERESHAHRYTPLEAAAAPEDARGPRPAPPLAAARLEAVGALSREEAAAEEAVPASRWALEGTAVLRAPEGVAAPASDERGLPGAATPWTLEGVAAAAGEGALALALARDAGRGILLSPASGAIPCSINFLRSSTAAHRKGPQSQQSRPAERAAHTARSASGRAKTRAQAARGGAHLSAAPPGPSSALPACCPPSSAAQTTTSRLRWGIYVQRARVGLLVGGALRGPSVLERTRDLEEPPFKTDHGQGA